MKKNTKYNKLIISVLVCVFAIYNTVVYNSHKKGKPIQLSKKAIEGEKLWQTNNCWSCHQLYGLGGYLGPDLTNVYSAPNKGATYIKAFLNSGVKAMPKFHFTDKEKNQIVAFLQQVDSTGYYPNKKAVINSNGWVDIQYKNEK